MENGCGQGLRKAFTSTPQPAGLKANTTQVKSHVSLFKCMKAETADASSPQLLTSLPSISTILFPYSTSARIAFCYSSNTRLKKKKVRNHIYCFLLKQGTLMEKECAKKRLPGFSHWVYRFKPFLTVKMGEPSTSSWKIRLL